VEINWSSLFVHIGPVAIRPGKYWIGVASGNRFCTKQRRTASRAIEDARKMEQVGDRQ
jgi:hypothetical protein